MPELPDIQVYVEAIDRCIAGQRLDRLRITSPFFLRSVAPAPKAIEGAILERAGRIGKRIVLHFDNGHAAVIHLMIAGRMRWRAAGAKAPGRTGLALLAFEAGTLVCTEASSKKRASLHIVGDEASLGAHDPGGIDPMACTVDEFTAALQRNNHTIKRALTDPTILAGIGNAYSDEVLHAARLAPHTWTTRLDQAQLARLHGAVQNVLTTWTQRLRDEVGDGFPDKVTAFRKGMAVHGRYGEPCPICATPVQRIRYADNESNYCPTCQTGGKLLADRSLSRLFRGDWPKTLEELDARMAGDG